MEEDGDEQTKAKVSPKLNTASSFHISLQITHTHFLLSFYLIIGTCMHTYYIIIHMYIFRES